MNGPTLASLLLASTFLSSAVAAPQFKAAEKTAWKQGSKALAQADAAIREADLRSYVTQLASPEYEGRGTGDKGERMATSYLASFFKGLKLRPAGAGDSYFQTFDFPAGMELKGDNALTFPAAVPPEIAKALKPGEHYQPLSMSKSGQFAHEVVFAGFGIAAKDYDSFEELDVKNKWIVVLRGHPEARPNLRQHGPLIAKAHIAITKKAAGIIYVKGTNPAISAELFPPSVNLGQGELLPALTITDHLAATLLTGKPELVGLKVLFESYSKGEKTKGFKLDYKIAATIGVAENRDEGRNVIARLIVGEEPSAEAIVIGAHIDHLGHGNRGGSRAKGEAATKVHLGADDNASGVAAMMELAQSFAAQKKAGTLSLKRDLIFAGWSGEEMGLYGSKHYVNKATADGGDLYPGIAAYLNLDMVGRLKKDGLSVQGVGSSKAWPALLDKIAQKEELRIVRSPNPYLPTDTTPFYDAGVPVLAAFTGLHEEYHTPNDTIDTIDFAGLDQVTNYVGKIAAALAERPEAPDYVKVERNRNRGPNSSKVLLGIQVEPNEGAGVKIGGVVKESAAARAGIQQNDILQSLNGKDVKDVAGMMQIVSKLEPNQEYQLIVMRGGEQIQMTITPAKR